MSVTKAAFAEKAIQSWKQIIYRYIEDHGEKFNPNLQKFVYILTVVKIYVLEIIQEILKKVIFQPFIK